MQYRDACGVGHRALPDFFARFGDAFRLEMGAFVSACRGEQPSPLTLNDATEATRIGQAITQSLRSGMPVLL
ncbi:inositol 2-dehydrogenase [compost metagenome]